MIARCAARVRLAAMAALSLGLRPAVATADAPPRAPGPDSLLERVGAVRLEQALRGSKASERERALLRLGALGTARSLELVVHALDSNGAAQSPRERLIAVRTLAAHVKEPLVRECLVRVMTGVSTSAERADPLQALLRDTAALALSASGEPEAFDALGKALRQSGRVAEAASAAIGAHPPSDLSSLVRAHYAPTPELLNALDALGDERTFELLRDVVRRGAPELRARAAVALTRLGNFETVELAQSWAEPTAPPVLRFAAAEILLLARDARVEPLLAALLADPRTHARALELATKSGGSTSERPLLSALSSAESDDIPAFLAALGKSGGKAAIFELAKRVPDPKNGDAAAYALATAASSDATPALVRLLGDAASRRRAARALTLRAAILGEVPRELSTTLRRLLASSDPADRAVAAFGLALHDTKRLPELIRSRDSVVAQGAARAALANGAARVAAARLLDEPAGETRVQLALALANAEARALVPTRVLLELATESPLVAPLALFALAERDDEALRARLLDALSSPDARLRAHTALGLGASRSPTAVSVLEAAYRFEPEAEVRRALVRALARRPERVRRRALELARDLDPDPDVRELAALALQGVVPAVFAKGRGVVWLTLEARAGEPSLAALQVPGGLSLPIAADPDGVVACAGLPEGAVSVRLAGLGARRERGSR
jgi:HEAT repeat protein